MSLFYINIDFSGNFIRFSSYPCNKQEKKEYSRMKKHIWNPKMSRMIQRYEKESVILGFAILVMCAFLYQQIQGNESVKTNGKSILSEKQKEENDTRVVVIDAGHGGRDGGKLSVDGVTYEKDINLEIAYKLKSYLEAQNITVIMTREGDDGLYTESDHNKKAADLKRRIEIIDKAAPDLVISIHQNSYHETSIKGAQTFYYTGSENGKKLAQILQDQLRIALDPDNNRQAKANDSYYLLKKTAATIVIVECGFLSNPDEAALLKTEEYQDRVAWNIHLGIMQYLNQKQNS